MVAALACSFLLSFCGGESEEDHRRNACTQPHSTAHALWSEFLEPEAVLEQVPFLADHSISLYQNIRSEQIGSSRIEDFLREASCSGLEVRAWLTLPEEEGYWPNEKNADLFSEKALELADWIRSRRLPITWIVVDMEPDLQTSRRLDELLKRRDIPGAVRLLLDNRDPERFSQAKEDFTNLVDTLHGLDFKVMVVTFPMVLDDISDGDDSLQDMMNTPVDGIPWDEFSFMVYTSTFGDMLGTQITPYLVYAYARDARTSYGDRAAVDIGVIGHAGMSAPDGIVDLQEILDQVGAAKEAGVSRIHAYSLDGILTLGDRTSWYGMFEAPPRPAGEQKIVNTFRDLLQFIDRMLVPILSPTSRTSPTGRAPPASHSG